MLQGILDIQAFLKDAESHDRELIPIPDDQEFTPIELHLDGDDFPAWQGFVRTPRGIAIHFPPLPPLVMTVE